MKLTSENAVPSKDVVGYLVGIREYLISVKKLQVSVIISGSLIEDRV